MDKPNVVTRFAPSPTGFLHIGAIRTALFAYLYAKANNGKFILRIEDTDQERFVPGAVEDIQEQLKWLGIVWDEGPVYQSKRLEHYQKYARELIENGKAFYCFCSKERLDSVRKEQELNKLNFGYDGYCKGLSLAEADSRIRNGEKAVVRFRIPKEGKTILEDAIRGRVEFENELQDDLVILKADGFPTYHLAHVVDDHLMGVTHVHRGEEWISSAPKHIMMFKAFGWETPQYVHLPVILSQDGGKLSKRKGATFVREFREKGYLREAMINFMVLLGWSYDDKEEFFTMEGLKKIFTHEKISKASPVFSFEKLDWFNGMYIRKTPVSELADLIRPYLVKAGKMASASGDKEQKYLEGLLELMRERTVLLSDFPVNTSYFFGELVDYKEPQLLIPKKSNKEETIAILNATLSEFIKLEDFSVSSLEQKLRELAENLQVKTGNLFMPIRIAVSGSTASPGLFEMISLIGKTTVVKRIEKAIEVLTNL